MRFDILTIFPDLLGSPLREGIIRRAVQAGKISVGIHDIRAFTTDRHRKTDDRPFGGGEGMVMKPEPLAAAVEAVSDRDPGSRVVLLTPQGRPFNHAVAQRLAGFTQLVLVCGRYEGVDERFVEGYVREEISIGDYILSGGELAALVLVDSVTRLLPGVLGCADSAARDSFSRGLLKYPQYTRPRRFNDREAPEVLFSGDHAAIAEWRFIASVRRTLERRPELLADIVFSEDERTLLRKAGLADAVSKSRTGAGRDE